MGPLSPENLTQNEIIHFDINYSLDMGHNHIRYIKSRRKDNFNIVSNSYNHFGSAIRQLYKHRESILLGFKDIGLSTNDEVKEILISKIYGNERIPYEEITFYNSFYTEEQIEKIPYSPLDESLLNYSNRFKYATLYILELIKANDPLPLPCIHERNALLSSFKITKNDLEGDKLLWQKELELLI